MKSLKKTLSHLASYQANVTTKGATTMQDSNQRYSASKNTHTK